MNLRQLRYFARIVELRNITRAAEQLHIAQPALGQHIRQLEEELGVALFARHSRGVDPTPAGQLLYERTMAIMSLLEETRHDVQRLGENRRRLLSIGLTPGLVHLVGLDLQLAADAAPDVVLRIHEDPSFMLCDAVERKELDLALACADARPDLQLRPVIREELVFVSKADGQPCPATVSLAEVAASRLAMGGARDAGLQALARALRKPPALVSLAFEVQSIAAIRELVLRGSACSLMPYGTVAREIEAGALRMQRVEDGDLTTMLYLVSRPGGEPLPPSVDALLAQLTDLVAQRLGPLATRP